MQNLNVGLIQTILHWEDKQANFKHLEAQFFSKIKPESIDLLLLPEMFNTGFSMNVDALSENMQGNSIQWLQKWAGLLKCAIGGSLIVREGDACFNRFIIVSESGIESWYDKRHLFRMAGENDRFTPGENRVVFQFKGWNLMLQVCYDLRFPVFSRNGVIEGKKEYDALIYVANWPEKRAFIWKNLIQARAIENQAFAIGLNRVGQDGKGIDYSGDSMFVDPWGNIRHQCEPHQEQFQIITLERKILDDITVLFPAFLDAD